MSSSGFEQGKPFFPSSLKIEQIGWKVERPHWRLITPLFYWSVLLGDNLITVPIGFLTDLASVPRLPFTWFLAGGRVPRPAVIHDYLYQKRGFDTSSGFIPVTRQQADAVFFEAMKADPIDGSNFATRWMIWGAVRLGGARGWWREELERHEPD